MALRQTIGLGGAAASLVIGLTCFSRSRWGPKAKAAAKEFHRASYNALPTNWSGPIFKPQLDYPMEYPPSSEKPWERIDFKKDPEKYMQYVLEYCFEGNVENGFVPQKNPKRRWFHAPWMCQTATGREPIHGLTYERPAPVGYLAETQNRVCQNWAVAMYNEQGETICSSQY